LLVGVAIGIEYQKTKHSPIYMEVVGGLGKPQALLNPRVGDIILWRNPDGTPTTLNWAFSSPCEVNKPGSCKIKKSANGKTYSYSCSGNWGCDPEAPIGDVNPILGTTMLPPLGYVASAFPEPLPEIVIGCAEGTQNPVNTNPNPAPVSETLQGGTYWKGIIDTTSWTVGNWTDQSGNPANVCNEGTINQGQPKCTLVAGLATGLYNYTGTSNACAAATGKLQLQVGQ